MRSKSFALFLSLLFFLLVGCSKESGSPEITPQIELVQSSSLKSIESEGKEVPEEVEFPMVQEIYIYDPKGRRDPFVPLIIAEGERLPGEERKISVENLSLVGVIWGDGQRIAILSDQAGNGYVFKEGESIPGGRVISISDRSVVFELSQFGIVTKYEIAMEE